MAQLRALARLVALLLLVALAAAGAAFAVGALKISHDLSLPGIAEHLHLPRLSHQTGELIHDLEAPGPMAIRTALAGAAAVVLAAALILGALWPRRPRLVLLEDADEGRMAARRRPLRRLARALAAGAEGVRPSGVRIRAGRRRGLRVRVVRERDLTGDEARLRAETSLAPLTAAFSLPASIRSRREWRR